MIHHINERLKSEARRYHLVFACPDCAAFDPGLDQDSVPDQHPNAKPRCSLGYPIDPHVNPSLDGRSELIFCKAFELW